ncbi:MAG: methyltransferase domain-containing protein [Candidatus Uhrbacteria bacterium]|nr:methyltransferase domain-containing protein [Candidatus Uhrbacteria bacterium]
MQIYDLGVATLWPYRKLIDTVLELSEVQSGDTVIDAGCGTGNLIARIAVGMECGKVIGLDWQPVALDFARAKMLQGRREVRSEFLTCDLDNEHWSAALPLADVVFSVNALYALGDPGGFLRIARGVLKPEGRLVLVNPFQPDLDAIQCSHDIWLSEEATQEDRVKYAEVAWATKVARAFNDVIAEAVGRKQLHFWQQERLADELNAAGFTVQSMHQVYAGTSLLAVALK